MDDSAWVERTRGEHAARLSRLRTIRDELSAGTVPRFEQLSRQLDQVFAAWEAAIAQAVDAPPANGSTELRRPARDVIRDADELLATLGRDAATFADEVDRELTAAQDWAQRAAVAVQAGLDDSAKEALHHHRAHVDQAERFTAELHVVESLRDALAQTLGELRASLS